MVMEARKKKTTNRNTDIVISDEPAEDEELADYTGEDPGEDEQDATPEDYNDDNVISDEPEEDEAVDYGEGDPGDMDEVDTDGDPNPEGEDDVPDNENPDTPPPEEAPENEGAPVDQGGGGGVTVSDQEPAEDENADAGGTDYGEGAPEAPGQEQQGQPNQQEGETPPGGEEGGEQPPEGEGGEQPPPEGEEGAEGEVSDDDGPAVDEPEKNAESRNVANNILLLRSFNRLHGDIRKFIKRVSNAKHQSVLGSVTYKQVVENLNQLRDMVYKYILLSYDSSTYDENLNNYYYFIEIMHWNLAMLEKVNEIVDKANNN